MKLITLTLLVNEEELRGDGTELDPYRRIIVAEMLDGKQVVEYDPHTNEIAMTENLVEAIRNAPRELLDANEMF